MSERGNSTTDRLRLTAGLGPDGQIISRGKGNALDGEWQIVLEFTQVGERLYPSRLELDVGILSEDVPAGGITARLLHSIRLGQLVDRFRMEHQANLDAEGLFFGRPTKPTYRLPPPGNRPGPKGRDEAFYQNVAVNYVKAFRTDARRPIALMAPLYQGYTRENVRDWVAKARQKGYLPPPGRGRAGGEPTRKLLDALRARGRRGGRKGRPRKS